MEGATLPQLPGGFFEILIANDRAGWQSAGSCDFLLRKTLAAGHFYLKKLVGGRRSLSGRAFRGLRLSVNWWDSEISKRDEKEQGSRQQPHPKARGSFL